MNILSIDTSCGSCSVCIMKDGIIIADLYESTLNIQAEELMDMIQDALAASKFKYDDIENIAVTVGPGSFTGIRIGMAAALGIKFAINAPIIGINTFESMLHSKMHNFSSKNQSVLCLVYASRKHFYAQEFKFKQHSSSPRLISEIEIEQFCAYSEVNILTNLAIDGIDALIIHPTAVGTLNAAIFKMKNGFITSNQDLVYIRSPF